MTINSNCICIYVMINTITYQWYIGQTIRFLDRMDEHFKGVNIDTQWIDYDCLKYGRKAFICEPLEIFEEYDKDLLNEREKYWIEEYDTFKNPNHYNLTPGGDGFGAGKEHPCYRDDLDDDILRIEYCNNKLNYNKIAKKYNTTPATVKRRLINLGIDTSHTDYHTNYRDDLDNDLLAKDYVENKLSCRKIARKYNTTEGTVRRRLNKLGIDTSHKNTTGFYRVSKKRGPTYKQGFCYVYSYRDNNDKGKTINSVSLKKLEIKVKEKGLPWKKL